MNRFYKSLLLILVLPALLFGAAFNRPSSLINVPFSQEFVPGQVDVGTSAAHSNQDNESDLFATYAFSDRIVLGANMINSSTAVLHGQVFLWGNERSSFSVGMANIAAEEVVTSWERFPENTNNTMGTYITSSTRWGQFNLHLGLGSGPFKDTLGQASNALFGARGLFWGIDAPMPGGRAIFEFDGRDLNLGYKYTLSPVVELGVAYTEAFLSGNQNQNYNNAPVRSFTVAVTAKNILEHTNLVASRNVRPKKKRNKALDALKKENAYIKDQLETLWDRLESIELQEPADPPEINNNLSVTVNLQLDEPLQLIPTQAIPVAEPEPAPEVVPTSDEDLIDDLLYEEPLDEAAPTAAMTEAEKDNLGEEVLRLYYESFTHYYKGDYLKAVDALNKAIKLQPKVPLLHIRLGTIYYELGLKEEAFMQWTTVLELDPFNEEVQELLNLYQE